MRVIDYRRMSDEDILNLEHPTNHSARGDDRSVDHWVTIDHQHIPMSEPRGRQSQEAPSKSYSGDATFYNLPGHKTAGGSHFDPNGMAAAMTAEKAKLGQTVKVTYSYVDEHGKTVTRTISVVVNDRGPLNGTQRACQNTRFDPIRTALLTLHPKLLDNWSERSESGECT